MNPLDALARQPFAKRRRAIERHGIEHLRTDWSLWCQPGQGAPPGDWRTWLMMAGRGFGKTRAGAEWVRSIAERGNSKTAIAFISGTIGDARNVMVEGESGILAVSPSATRPLWEPARGRLLWRSGAQAFVYSAENPEKLRGPQHGFAWCDELAKWAYPKATWDNLQLGLRLGERPRTMITTTPRAVLLIRALVNDPSVIVTRGATHDNAFLPHAFVEAMTDDYGGTRLGRQELNGELIDDVAGALWTRAMIDECRVRAVPGLVPDLRRVVIGVDPPASTSGDACGIVCVGLGADDIGYVMEDASVSGLSPEGWAGVVADVASVSNVQVMAVGVGDATGVLGSGPIDAGAAVRPLSVVRMTAILTGGDHFISWTRRSRDGWRWRDNVDVPIGEETERYRLTKLASGRPDLVTEVMNPSWVYSAAEGAADLAAGAIEAVISVQQVGSQGISKAATLSIATS